MGGRTNVEVRSRRIQSGLLLGTLLTLTAALAATSARGAHGDGRTRHALMQPVSACPLRSSEPPDRPSRARPSPLVAASRAGSPATAAMYPRGWPGPASGPR